MVKRPPGECEVKAAVSLSNAGWKRQLNLKAKWWCGRTAIALDKSIWKRSESVRVRRPQIRWTLAPRKLNAIRSRWTTTVSVTTFY